MRNILKHRRASYVPGHPGHDCHSGVDGKCFLLVRDKRGRLVDNKGRVCDPASGLPVKGAK